MITSRKMPRNFFSALPRGMTLASIVSASLLMAAVTNVEAAQRMCGERAKLADFLKKKYQEAPIGLGVGGSGKTVYEVFTSQKGTWTVMMTMTTGKSCIMATGHSWRDDDRLAYLPKV